MHHDLSDDHHEDDVSIEHEEGEQSLSDALSKIKKLRADLKEAHQKRDEYLAGWQREKADAVNLKRELSHDAIRMGARIKQGLIEDLLPALDSFDMAYASPQWESIDPIWRTGMEAVRGQLFEMLSKNGIERFGTIGDVANPHLHEVLQEIPDGEGESGAIIRVIRSGYRAGDHVLRAAQVVAKA
jgi:molecular chaperone GrpE